MLSSWAASGIRRRSGASGFADTPVATEAAGRSTVAKMWPQFGQWTEVEGMGKAPYRALSPRQSRRPSFRLRGSRPSSIEPFFGNLDHRMWRRGR
jgi:hypothetical protein